MLTLSEVENRELKWVESTGESWKYALRANGDEIGSLQFDPDSESRAVGELSGQRWTFDRQDSMQSYVVVCVEGSKEPIATVASRWRGGGSVRFNTGARYCWNMTHLWSSTWCFRREGGRASVCVTGDAPSRHGSKVKVCRDAARLAETPVLVLLGWFLEILLHEQIAKTAV